MTEKRTDRVVPKDPFGVGEFVKEAPGAWFPNGAKPTATPTLSANPLVPQGTGQGTLSAYRQAQEVQAGTPEAAAPTLGASGPAAKQPSLLGGGAGASAAGSAPAPSAAPQPVAEVFAPQAPPSDAELFRDEMKLQILRGMFPQHQFTPVEYDPFKAVPKGLGGNVDVNRGVG